MPQVRRRAFLSGLGASAAAICLVGERGEERPAPAFLNASYEGCSVISAHAHLGALVILARDSSDEVFQVDVLRRDPGGPDGIAETESLALFLANRGDGSAETHEEHGLFVMELAARLSKPANVMALDASLAEQGSGPLSSGSLMSWNERRGEHPSGSFSLA